MRVTVDTFLAAQRQGVEALITLVHDTFSSIDSLSRAFLKASALLGGESDPESSGARVLLPSAAVRVCVCACNVPVPQASI